MLIGLRLSGGDVGDLDLGVLLTVTLALLVTGLVLELLDDDLRALGGTEDLGRHGRLAQRAGVRGDLLTVDEQHHGKVDGVADLAGNLVDLDDVTDSNLLLLAATAHDRVHRGLTLFVGLQVRLLWRDALPGRNRRERATGTQDGRAAHAEDQVYGRCPG